jgi:hypothetical protein
MDVSIHRNSANSTTIMPPSQILPLLLLAYLSISTADYVKFSTDQQGFFLQEQSSVNKNPPDYVCTHQRLCFTRHRLNLCQAQTSLGLIPRPYVSDSNSDPSSSKTQWERFFHYVQYLNQHSGSDVSYKVLFLARHGEAYHNVAEKYYGTDCWNVGGNRIR